tara:strand:+ start:51 stop:521 length:471 start_codon:yes stop_codon:yes gene_type:complete
MLHRIGSWIIRFIHEIFSGRGFEIPSPPDVVKMEDIRAENYVDGQGRDRVRVIIDGLLPPIHIMPIIHDTNSMDGILDLDHHYPISNNPEYLNNVKVGSVVYWEKYGVTRIHQVIEIGKDKRGWFCYCKGWNLSIKDPYRLRREDVKWVAPCGVIW